MAAGERAETAAEEESDGTDRCAGAGDGSESVGSCDGNHLAPPHPAAQRRDVGGGVDFDIDQAACGDDEVGAAGDLCAVTGRKYVDRESVVASEPHRVENVGFGCCADNDVGILFNSSDPAREFFAKTEV